MSKTLWFYEPEGPSDLYQCLGDNEECESEGEYLGEGGEHDGERICWSHLQELKGDDDGE